MPAEVAQPAAAGPQSKAYADAGWRVVDVPHDFVVETQPFNQSESNHGYRPKNVSWYRKTFSLEAGWADRAVRIEFDGIYRSADLWLNGRHVLHHASGYTGVALPLTAESGAVFGGANVLAIRVDPRANEGWWYEGGGLYRHTRLVVTSPVAIVDESVYVPSTVMGPIKRDAAGGQPTADAGLTIFAAATAAAAAERAALLFSFRVLAPSGSVAWSGSAHIAPASLEATTTAKLVDAELWEQRPDGADAALYTLETTLSRGTTVLDTLNVTFGVRSVAFEPPPQCAAHRLSAGN